MTPVLGAALQSDISAYIAWLNELETLALASPGGKSRWFYSDSFAVYTRITNWKLAMPGIWVVCLANIEVAERYRGLGLFSALLAVLHARQGAIRADAVYVESVINKRLREYLVRNGFEPARALPDELPSYKRTREQEKPQS